MLTTSILQERTQESAGILRRTPHATLSRSEPHKESPRRKDLSEERRPPSRRSTQDQQHSRTSPPRRTNGKEENHRGNRGWAARRCNGHGMRRSRTTIRDIHGPRRYGKAEAQRLPDENAGCRSPPGRLGLKNPQRRNQRVPQGLGNQRREHLLPARLRRGTPPIPDHSPRLPEHHRKGGPTPDPRARRQAPPGCDRLRWGRKQLHRNLPPIPP